MSRADEALKGIIEKIGYDYDIDIVELEIPKDHIHMVVRGEPKKAPSGVIFGEGNCGCKVILLK